MTPGEAFNKAALAAVQDCLDVLNGTGRHADHKRRQVGRCVICECGKRVQGKGSWPKKG